MTVVSPRPPDDITDDRPHRGRALRVEHRRRLVEQQHPRRHGERPGEGKPLLLAARQRVRGHLRRAPRPHLRQRWRHRRGHLGPGHTDVLESERDVARARWRPRPRRPGPAGPARPCPGTARGRHRRRGPSPVRSPASAVSSSPADGPQQRRLARPAGPDEQHALAGSIRRSKLVEHRTGAPVGTPGQAVDLHAGAARRPVRAGRAGVVAHLRQCAPRGSPDPGEGVERPRPRPGPA